MRFAVAVTGALTIVAAGIAWAQPPAGGAPREGAAGGPPRGGFDKRPDLPPSVWNGSSTVTRTNHRHEWVEIPLAGSVGVRTWIEYPDASAAAPVAIVLHYDGGLDDWTRGVADQLASEGFIAVAPDLFSGFGPGGGGFDSFRTQDEAIRAGREKLTQDEAMRRVHATAAHAAKMPRANGKIAAVGFGSGGSHAFRFAADAPTVNAVAVFYGSAPGEAVLRRIKAPLIGFYGADDPRVSANVGETAETMSRLGKSFEHHIYAGATHDFALIQIEGLNGPAIEDAWTRAIAFLKTHVQ